MVASADVGATAVLGRVCKLHLLYAMSASLISVHFKPGGLNLFQRGSELVG